MHRALVATAQPRLNAAATAAAPTLALDHVAPLPTRLPAGMVDAAFIVDLRARVNDPSKRRRLVLSNGKTSRSLKRQTTTKMTTEDDAASTVGFVVADETKAGIETEAAGPAQRTKWAAEATKSAAATVSEAEGAAAEAADVEAEDGLGLVEVDVEDASDEDALGAEAEADDADITASPRAAKVPDSQEKTRKEASAGAAGATAAMKASEGHDEELSDSDARTTRNDVPSPSDEEEEGSYDARTHTRPTTAAGAEGEEEDGTAATAAVGTTSDMDAVRDEEEVATNRRSYV